MTNQVVDVRLLMQTAERAREMLGVETINVLANHGYFKKRGYRGLREKKTGCVLHIPQPQRGSSVRRGLPHDLQASTTAASTWMRHWPP